VVVVGANLGNVFASHLDAVVGAKNKIYVAYDNPVTEYSPERSLYEQGYITKFNYSSPTRQVISKNNGQSDYVGVDKFHPDANEVVLRNGRTIKYENLVIATGQKQNFQEIKGFEDAWADVVHPFYTNADHLSWKTSVSKSYRVHLNFNGGNAFFYIPPGNFYG
jgi:sulfide:quinone oxidoreductase